VIIAATTTGAELKPAALRQKSLLECRLFDGRLFQDAALLFC
jgi:hypothetical protein